MRPADFFIRSHYRIIILVLITHMNICHDAFEFVNIEYGNIEYGYLRKKAFHQKDLINFYTTSRELKTSAFINTVCVTICRETRSCNEIFA